MGLSHVKTSGSTKERAKVLITNFHPGDGGGHTTYILRLLSAGLPEHFDIALAVPESSRLFADAQQSGVKVFPCDFPGKFKEIPAIVRAIRRFGQIHRAFPFQAVHCNAARDHAIAAWWKVASNGRVRILRTHHAIRQTPDDPYHRWLHNRLTDLHIFVSHAQLGLNEAGKALKHPASVVITNGLDLASYSPAAKSEQVLRELGVRPGQMIFGTVGGTATHKRVDVMLRAVAGLPDRSRVLVVVLGGEITGRKVCRLAESLQMRDQFRFAGLQSDVKPYISVFDVGFVLSDSIETSSFAAREMMAMGVPMICSGYSGLLEVVEDRLNGFITTPGSVAEVASRVQEFLSMPEEQMKKFRQAARDKAVRCFGQELMIRKTREAYQRVLA
jgi:glycosyltransferase involved in cell wall biosynthesis